MRDEKESNARTTAPFSLSEHRPTWAEINLDNLVHNFQMIRSAVGAGVAIMPAVKADAYGHGAVECARALERAGAEWFGVALPEEGAQLRDASVARPILCLGSFWEGQEELIVRRQLTPVVFRVELLERLDRAARAAGIVADYHLKVDTGMGRLGVRMEGLTEFLSASVRFRNLKLDGVMTHFASADKPDKSQSCAEQMNLFESAVAQVRAHGHKPRWIHQANSAAITAYPRSRWNMVRPGGVLYGLWRDVINPLQEPLDWRAVMSLHTRIILLKSVPPGTPVGYGETFATSRESRLATIPIGYEDGLRRALSNTGHVIVGGREAAIVGRISMDLTIIDVTDIEGVRVGDEVVIIGRQGNCELSVERLAAQLGTISYEVTCGISSRVPRLYLPRA